MIVPALVLEMQRQGLGKVNTDLFWEELPADPQINGIWVVSRGDAGSSNDVQAMQIDIYARYANKLTTALKLRAIANWVRGKAQDICSLTVNPHDLDKSQPNTPITFDVISIEHTGAAQNQGVDENFRVLKAITIQIKFNERIEDGK